MRNRGFTLLEVLIATVVMAVAITGLMSALSTSMRSAARLTDYDRAVLLGRQKMDELLISVKLPKGTPIEGTWDASTTGGLAIGWRARFSPFEMPPSAGQGTRFLERIQLEIFWTTQSRERSFRLEGFRSAILTPEDVAVGIGTGP